MDLLILMVGLVVFSPIILLYRLFTGDRDMPPGSRLQDRW